MWVSDEKMGMTVLAWACDGVGVTGHGEGRAWEAVASSSYKGW